MTEVQALKVHVSINVRNVETSIDFYRRMLGIEPSKVRTGYAKFDVQNPPVNLALNEVPTLAEPGALSHLGIQVASTDDVFAIRQRWADAGLVTRDEMQTDCCYAKQDKTWVHDPDGNEWEVFVVLEDNLPETQRASSCCVSERPLVCDMSAFTPEQRERHLAATRSLVTKATRTELEDGYALSIDRNDFSPAQLAQWLANESRCCPALDFHVELPALGPLTLRIGGGAHAKPFIAAELAF